MDWVWVLVIIILAFVLLYSLLDVLDRPRREGRHANRPKHLPDRDDR